MDNKLKQQLQQLGFEEQEAEIYLACLLHEIDTPTGLARATGMKRSTVYFYLHKLKEKGMIGTKVKKRKKYIQPIPVNRAFNALAEEIKENAQQLEQKIQRALPTFEKLVQQRSEHQHIEQWEGKKGIQLLIGRILETQKDLFWIGSLTRVLEIFGEEAFYRMMTLRRMQQQTTAYAITDRRILATKKFSEKIGDFRRFLFLEKPIEIPSIFCVFGPFLGLLSVEGKDIRTIIIKDPALADIVRLLFNVATSDASSATH